MTKKKKTTKTDVNYRLFDAVLARSWCEEGVLALNLEAKTFIEQTVIPYVRNVALQGMYVVELPPVRDKLSSYIEQQLAQKGFEILSITEVSVGTEPQSVITVSWADNSS